MSELAQTAAMSLRAFGSVAAANVSKDVTSTSPTRAARYQAACQNTAKPTLSEISADIALNLIITGKMNTRTYELIRQLTHENCSTSMYPFYHKIIAAKTPCYPPKSDITITETLAEVSYRR